MIATSPARRILLAAIVAVMLPCDLVNGQETGTAAPTVAPTSTPWGGCVDPSNRGAKVTIGERTTVCLVIANGVDWQEERKYIRLNFRPIADQYSRFTVPDCE